MLQSGVLHCPFICRACVFFFFFFFNDTATTEIYTLSLHDALPISDRGIRLDRGPHRGAATRRTGRSEEHTSELQSRGLISYAVFCLKKTNNTITTSLSGLAPHTSRGNFRTHIY